MAGSGSVNNKKVWHNFAYGAVLSVIRTLLLVVAAQLSSLPYKGISRNVITLTLHHQEGDSDMDLAHTQIELHHQPSVPGGGNLRRLVRLYLKQLESNPVLTKAITSSVLAALGDITSQVIVQVGKPNKQFSLRSTAAYATFGFVVTGPLTHYLYQFLEAIVPRKTQLSSLRKVIIERLLFAPPYLLALFIIVALLEGKSLSVAWSEVKKVFLPVLMRNWIIWGLAQYINMSYVPVKFRVLFANMVALVWNIYLAILRR